MPLLCLFHVIEYTLLNYGVLQILTSLINLKFYMKNLYYGFSAAARTKIVFILKN